MHTSFSPLRTPLRLTVMAALLASLSVPALAASDVVISQVYGGGGNNGALYRNDFIELFNRGASPVNLSNWSVQYASAAGSTWAVTALPAIDLQAGQYLLVQQAKGTGGTQDLPTPDATGSLAMSGRLVLDPQRNAVYLSEASVDKVGIDGMDEAQQRQFAKVASLVADQLMHETPIYSFKPDELRYAGVQFVPTQLRTTGAGLTVTFEPVK